MTLVARFALLLHAVAATQQQQQANPIRKVVSMLHSMQQKVSAEGKHQEEAYNKFACYCKTSGGDLSASIQAAKNQIAALTTSTQTDMQKKQQTEHSLRAHTASRDEAKEAMSQATSLRAKEEAAYAKVKSDSEINIAALEKAIPLIEKGMVGSFLQTPAAITVKAYAMENADLPDNTRDELLAFLSGTHEQSYVPRSGEIVGILKTMHDEMSAGLSDATAEETGAIQNFDGLIAAKSQEVSTLQKQIEAEMTRVGELSEKLAGEHNDLEDTQESLAQDEQFKKDLETSCDTKAEEWELIKKTRAEELLTLAETIKVLNDDDALDLFKNTLPGASMSFVQVQVNRATQRGKALTLVKQARDAARNGRGTPVHPQLDFLTLALQGKKVGFGKVIKMIDTMVGNLAAEQKEDDSLKEYCGASFDKADDKKKALDNSISDSETAISQMAGVIAELADQIAQLEAGVTALDKSVSEATSLRQEDNADFKHLTSDDSTAKNLLLFAKNRLNQFYNPKLYKAPPNRELTAQERLTVSLGGEVSTPAPGGIAGTGIGAALVQFSMRKDAPPPPPETFGPYSKKGDTATGVVSMIDLLITDLDKEMQEASVSEKNSQQEYEEMMKASAAKRAADSKSITDKTAEKATTEEAMQGEQESKDDAAHEHMNTMKHIASLHGECDFLVQYYDARKQARTDEVESLSNAKAVLSGADYSFVQQGRLRGKISEHQL